MSAVYTSIIPVGPEGAGQNTPVEVANRLQQKDRAPGTKRFLDRLREMAETYSKEFQGVDWVRYQQYVTMEKFYRGEQLGYVSPLDRSLMTRGTSPGRQGLVDPIYVNNIVRPHANSIISQWTQAHTEVNVLALPDQNATEHAKGGARSLKWVLEHYDRKLISESFRQRECQNGMFSGNMIRFSWWNMQAGAAVQRAIYGSSAEQTPLAYFCPDCQSAGMLQEAATDEGPMCPECGNPELGVEGGDEVEMPVIQGYQQAMTGDLACLPVPSHEVKFDRSTVFLPFAEYLRWQFPIRPSFVRAIYPWWTPQGTTADSLNEPSRRAAETLARATGSTQRALAWGDDTLAKFCTASLWWYGPSAYNNDEIHEPIPLTSGESIEPGYAIERFPKGLYVCFVNNEPVDFYAADMLAHWQHTPYQMVANSIDGDGIWDILQDQRELNDIYSMVYNHIGNISGQGYLYDPNYIDRADVPSKPYMLGKIKSGVPKEIGFDRIVGPVRRESIGSEVFAYAQKREEQAQFKMKTFSPAMGSPDLTGASKTLGGMQLMSQGAQASRAPEMALRAMGDVETYYQWTALFQQNATDAQYVPFYGRIGKLEGQWFKNSDVAGTYLIVPRPRSFIPKDEAQRRNDFMAFLEAFGGPVGVAQAMDVAPNLVYEGQERFDVTFEIDVGNLVPRLVRYRLDRITEIADYFQMPEEVLMSEPDLIPDADEPHEKMVRELVTWKLTDEGIEARSKRPMVYETVTALIATHRQFLAQSAMAQMRVEQGQADQQADTQAGRDEQKAQADHGRKMDAANQSGLQRMDQIAAQGMMRGMGQ